MGQYTKIDNAYNFLSSTNEFNFDELKNASGWTIANTKANISKKLKGFLTNGDNKDYKIKEIFKTYSKDDFRSVFSQKYIVYWLTEQNERLHNLMLWNVSSLHLISR